MKCQVCQQDALLPFRCPFCGGQFCSEHRIPENHFCPGINTARAQTQQKVMTQQGYTSYNYSYVYGKDPYRPRNPIRWSQIEGKHVGIAAALVLAIGFSMAWYSFAWSILAMAIFALVMMTSFLTHEIAHKVMAQRAGMWAEFRLTTWGAVLTLVSVFLPFKMIAPGAMMIGGNAPSAKSMIKISIAGVATNIVYSAAFLGLFTLFSALPVNGDYTEMLLFAAYINAFMAIFNLLPFGVLDGYKLFMLNKKLWAVTFVLAIAVIAITLTAGWNLIF